MATIPPLTPVNKVKTPLPLLLAALLTLGTSCATGHGSRTQESEHLPEGLAAARTFLAEYEQQYQELYSAWYESEWQANIRIVEGDDSLVEASEEARREYAAFTGSVEVIEQARALLALRRHLTPVQVRQLERVLYLAAGNPQTRPELVNALIQADARQNKDLFAFEFQIDGEVLTPNEIDKRLRESEDLEERRKVWEASKEVGPALKQGLLELRDLRNKVVQAMDYPDFYSYQVSDYGMNAEDMNALMIQLNRELRPLYRELHTWARYELAERYGQPVPDLIPAHWLPDRWAQDWADLVDVEGVDITATIGGKDPEWVVRQGEDFYVSLGFPRLPATFWEKSSLYPLPADSDYKKNTHASAWHMNLADDVRTLMSIEANAEWYETVHHELGHIYYYVAYTNPEVPLLLREGANRGFHEAIGSQMGLAAMQVPFLQARGLVGEDIVVPKMQLLLKEALNNVIFIGFGAGTMPMFESALYRDELPPEQFNSKWWELVARFQGVAPPEFRGEEYADALSKTHINNDPAQYYDYALSTVLLFQFHDYIAKNILQQDPRATNYFGSKEVGDFIKGILSPGATQDWRKLLRESTGSDMSAEPLLEYYAPLMEWLQEQNQGRTYTLPEL